MTDRAWGSFLKKLRGGSLFETAAEEAGIPLVEAVDWLKSRTPDVEADLAQQRQMAASAMRSGISALKKLARLKDGRVKSEGGEFGSTFDFPDLGAAKALVDAGIKLAKMGRPVKADPLGDADDLFDRPPSSSWKFKEKK